MNRPVVQFREVARDGSARAGVLSTPHGEVLTPTFMPVGTYGAVKTAAPWEVEATGARIVLGNTYHLWLRPGHDTVAELGGLHAFSRWPHAMLTDSGGFQAFSLSARCKLSEEGYTFRSHLDGKKLSLSPEVAMEVQRKLGADIAMQLDVCPPGEASAKEVERACRITTAWADRFLEARRQADEEHGAVAQAVFGIVQGGSDVKLRLAHANELAERPFEGLALGGFSVGEPIEQMHEVLGEVAHQVDPTRPRYLMGVGRPEDLVRGVAAGIDMFDCVMPTRNARNGQAMLRSGRLVIKNAKHKHDASVIDADCSCPACAGGFSRAYLRHLFLGKEVLALRLLSLHNLQLYADLMAEAREAIIAGRYQAFLNSWRET